MSVKGQAFLLLPQTCSKATNISETNQPTRTSKPTGPRHFPPFRFSEAAHSPAPGAPPGPATAPPAPIREPNLPNLPLGPPQPTQPTHPRARRDHLKHLAARCNRSKLLEALQPSQAVAQVAPRGPHRPRGSRLEPIRVRPVMEYAANTQSYRPLSEQQLLQTRQKRQRHESLNGCGSKNDVPKMAPGKWKQRPKPAPK